MALSPATNRVQLLTQWLLVGAIYFLGGWSVDLLNLPDGTSLLFWPSAGWALFAVYTLGVRVWPGVVLGQLLLGWYHGAPWLFLAGLLPGATLQALAGAQLLRRREGFHPTLNNLGDALWFVAMVVFCTVPISATLSLGGKALSGQHATLAAFGMDWWRWSVGDALGIVVVFPFLQNWLAHRETRASRQGWCAECVIISVLLQVIGLVVFDPLRWSGPEVKYLAFLPLPLLLWLAGRFGMRAATLNVLFLATMINLAAAGNGADGIIGSDNLKAGMRASYAFLLALSALLVAACAEELAARESRIRTLLEDAVDGIFLATPEGQMLDANRAGCAMVGYSLEELRQLRVVDLITLQGQREPLINFAALVTQDGTFEQRQLRCKDGTTISVEINARRLTDGRLQAVVRDVTARLKGDVAMRESERFARRILDTTPHIIYVFDLVTRRNVYANHQIAALLGYSPEQINQLGDDFLPHLLHPDDVGRLTALFARWATATDDDLISTEYRMKDVSGGWHWFLATDAVFRRDDEGKVIQIIGNAQDVTDRRSAQEKLRQENAFNQLVIASAGEGICVCHELPKFPFVRFTVWNQRMEDITGYPMAAINELGWYQSMYPDPDVQRRAIERMALMRVGNNLQGEQWEIVRRDGARRQILITTRLLLAEENEAHVLGVMNDITDRIAAEKLVAETASMYRRAIKAAHAVPYLEDHAAGEFTFMGEGIVQLTGYTAGEMTRAIWLSITESSIVHGEGAGRSMEEVIRLCRTGEIREWHCDTLIRTRGGELRWLEDSAVEIFGPDKVATGSIGILTDITERKRGEEALRDSEARFRAFLDNTPAAAFMKDESGRYVVGNTAWAAQFERPIGELLGRTDDELWDEQTALTFREGDREMLESNRVINRVQQGAMPDGTVRWWSVMKFPLLSVSGQRLIGGIALDITERKLAEDEVLRLNAELESRVQLRTEELNQRVGEVERLNQGMFNLLEDLHGARAVAEDSASKLRLANLQLRAINQELEAFSYSISHDLRAPLRHIHGFVRLVQKEAGMLGETGQHHLGIIADSATRMGRLIDDLLEFSRAGRSLLRPTMVDLNQLLVTVREDLERENEGRQIDWRIGVLPSAWGDRGMLRQVFYNLLGNAVKYTGRVEQAVIELHTLPPEEPGETLLVVRDNGTGFDMQFAGKLFGVFQRLHRADEFEGTGIGLANVRRILHRHGGHIRAEAELGRGAAFYFTLSVSPEAFAERQARGVLTEGES